MYSRSLQKRLLSTYYVPGTVLGTRDTAVKDTAPIPAAPGLTLQWPPCYKYCVSNQAVYGVSPRLLGPAYYWQ